MIRQINLKILLFTLVVVGLTACASANRYEEGGIVGTGHDIDCNDYKKNKKRNCEK